MITNEVDSDGATRTRDASIATVDMKLKAVVIPVSDADRAKKFYAGWRLDADFRFDNGFRVVQFTLPASPCSVQFETEITSAEPGSGHGIYLIVSDVEAARADRVAREAHRPRRTELARLVCRVHRGGAGRRDTAVVSHSRQLMFAA